jgi:hypothetical protein
MRVAARCRYVVMGQVLVARPTRLQEKAGLDALVKYCPSTSTRAGSTSMSPR